MLLVTSRISHKLLRSQYLQKGNVAFTRSVVKLQLHTANPHKSKKGFTGETKNIGHFKMLIFLHINEKTDRNKIK